MRTLEDLRRRLRPEAPYVFVVLFVVLLILIAVPSDRSRRNASAPERAEAPPAAEEETAPEGVALGKAYARRLWAWEVSLSVFVLLSGVCVLVAAGVRKLRGRALLTVVPALPATWSLWDALKVYCFQIVVFQCLAALLASALSSWSGKQIAMALTHVVAATAMVIVGLRVAVVDRRALPGALGLTPRTPLRYLRVGVLACLAFQPINIALGVGAQALFRYLNLRAPEQLVVRTFRTADSPWLLGALAFSAVVVAPVAEEFFYRGMLIPLFRRWLRPWLAILATAVLFSMAHVNLLVAAPIFALGLVLGYLFDRTRSLVAPIACHMAFNLMAVLFLFSIRP